MPKRCRRTISLRLDTWERFRDWAAEKGVSASSVIESYIDTLPGIAPRVAPPAREQPQREQPQRAPSKFRGGNMPPISVVGAKYKRPPNGSPPEARDRAVQSARDRLSGAERRERIVKIAEGRKAHGVPTVSPPRPASEVVAKRPDGSMPW